LSGTQRAARNKVKIRNKTMITQIDNSGNKETVENIELIERITKSWGKPSQVIIQKETGSIGAIIPEMKIKHQVHIGWITKGKLELV